MTKYGKADQKAKRDSKNYFGNQCSITGQKPIDGAHVYDSGVYKQFCLWLAKRDTLKFNIVPVINLLHIKHLHKKIDPEHKINWLKVSAADFPLMDNWMKRLELEVETFKAENGGQLKYKHSA